MTRFVLFALFAVGQVFLPISAPRADFPTDRVSTGDVVLEAGQKAGELVSLNGDIKIESGAQAKQATAIMGSVRLGPGAVVENEAVAIGGDLQVGPGARVGGEAVSIGGKLIVDPGGRVEGKQTSIEFPPNGKWPHHAWHQASRTHLSPLWTLGQVIAQFATFFALGLLLLVLFPARVEGVAASLGHEPAKGLLVGLLGTLALPVLTVLLVVTVVGIPLVPVELIAVATAGLLGFTALSLAVARRLPMGAGQTTRVAQLAIGTAIVVILMRIPVIGGLACAAGWLLAFGAVLRTRFGKPEAGNNGGAIVGAGTPGGPT